MIWRTGSSSRVRMLLTPLPDDDLLVGLKLLAPELLEGWSDYSASFLAVLPLQGLSFFFDFVINFLRTRQQLFKLTNERL